MRIERIEEWLGQTVVDREGEKVGKLEDLYFGAAGHEAVAGAVKTGLLGRRLNVVSLTGATVARDHVKIAFTKEQVKHAPQAEAGTDLAEPDRGELERHFDMTLPPGTLESNNARVERARRAQETAKRAEELEQEADKRAAEAREKDDAAKAAAKARDEAKREAEEARRAAEGPGGA